MLISVTLLIFTGLGVLYMAMSNRRALREMEHRERLAMIQRGLVPSPEVDPLGFETAADFTFETRISARSARWRSAGVMVIGLGLALMMLLSFTAEEPSVGVGVGGAFAVLGATLFFNGLQMSRGDIVRRPFYPAAPRPSQGRHTHQSNQSPPPEL